MDQTPQRFFYDWEFVENGKTIIPISVGVIHQDGTTYEAVFDEIQYEDSEAIFRHDFVREHVLPHLPIVEGSLYTSVPLFNTALRAQALAAELGTSRPVRAFQLDRSNPLVKPLWVIRRELHTMFEHASQLGPIELWTHYGSCDHRLLAQLWGTFQDRPDFMPMYSNDLMQLCGGNETALIAPLPAEQQHSALNDARWIRQAWAAWQRTIATSRDYLPHELAHATCGEIKLFQHRACQGVVAVTVKRLGGEGAITCGTCRYTLDTLERFTDEYQPLYTASRTPWNEGARS